MQKGFLLFAMLIALCGMTVSMASAQHKSSKTRKHRKQSSTAAIDKPKNENAGDARLRKRTDKVHRSSIVVDTHNDITSPITDESFDMGERDTSGKIQTDIPRMKEGGLGAEFFSIYVAAKYAKEGGAARRALDMIDGVYEQVRRHPKDLEMAFTVADIRRIRRTKKIAALMGIEGGHAIEDSL